MTIWLIGISFCVLVLLIAESRYQVSQDKFWVRVKILSKSLASIGFVLLFLCQTTDFNLFSSLILCALIFSLFGDLLLLPQHQTQFFKLGILAFALAHVAYAIAFATLQIELKLLILSVIATSIFGISIYRWLHPHLSPHFKWLVPIYLLLISIMLMLGLATGLSIPNYWLVSGSVGFALSDIFVARNRFVKNQFSNRLIGLPLYYGAQIFIVLAALEISSS